MILVVVVIPALIETVPYPTPGPSTPNWAPVTPTPNPPAVVFVVVVVTFVVPSAPPPNPFKSTVPPTRGRTFVPKSTVFLTVVVLIPSWTVLPVSITTNWVVPKSRAYV